MPKVNWATITCRYNNFITIIVLEFMGLHVNLDKVFHDNALKKVNIYI